MDTEHLLASAVGSVEAYLATAYGLPRAITGPLAPVVFDRVATEAHKRLGEKKKIYIKVWRTPQSTTKRGESRKQTHHLIFFFEPGDGEREARKAAEGALGENPGAHWAVSERCRGACAGIPVVGEDGAHG